VCLPVCTAQPAARFVIATPLNHPAKSLRDFAGASSPVAHWGVTGQLTALASNLPHSGRILDAYLHRCIVISRSGSRLRFFSSRISISSAALHP